MTTLTIEIPDNVETTLSDLVIKLGGKVINGSLRHPSAKTTRKKEEILTNLEQSVNFVALHKEDKVKAKSLEQLLDEL